MLEAADKLLVRTLQCHFGVDAVQSAHINQRKEQIAYLALGAILVATSHLDLNLCDLLLDLCPYILLLLPVEARRSSLLAHTESLDHSGQRAGYTAQDSALTLLLAQFQLLPVLHHLGRGVGVYVAIDVGVAVDKLVALGIGHIAKVETALFLAKFRIEDNVQQQIAQLLLYAVHIIVGYGIHQFVGLLYSVVAQRLEGLLTIPGALLAQGVHHLQQSCCGFEFFVVVHLS